MLTDSGVLVVGADAVPASNIARLKLGTRTTHGDYGPVSEDTLTVYLRSPCWNVVGERPEHVLVFRGPSVRAAFYRFCGTQEGV